MFLDKNILANYVGAISAALIATLSIPFFIGLLGAEFYGFIAFLLTIKGIFVTFDFGLGVTANREIAYQLGKNIPTVGSFFRTVERLYWILGLIIGAIFWLIFYLFLDIWIKTEVLNGDEIFYLASVFALSMMISWPTMLYRNCLRGLHKHLTFNVLLVSTLMVYNLGAIFVLVFVDASLEAFIYWYLIASVFELLAYVFITKRIVRQMNLKDARFDYNVLSGTKAFATLSGFSSVIATFILRLDRLIIPSILGLEALGYYSAILALVGIFAKLTTPIVTTIFPRLTVIYSKQDQAMLLSTYLQYTRLITYTLVPLCVGVVVFGNSILTLWLPDTGGSQELYLVLVILSIAYVFQSLTHLPIIIQLVYKQAKWLAISRTIALISLIPALTVLTTLYGMTGTALGVLIYSITMFGFQAFFSSRELSKPSYHGEWPMLLPPLLTSLIVFIPPFYFAKQFITAPIVLVILGVAIGMLVYLVLIMAHFGPQKLLKIKGRFR